MKPPPNPAERFMAAFPNAAETNGWTKENLTRLVRDAKRLGISDDEMQRAIELLIRRQRRTTVPLYPEVFGAMRDAVMKRAARKPDSTSMRLRKIREDYRPPTPEQKAARRAWLAERGGAA